MFRKRTGSTHWQLFSFKFFFLMDGQIFRCPLKLILYLLYFSLIDSLLNMDYQKCLQMYVLHLRCSGLLASRNTANILTMYQAARPCFGTDKLKHLDILLLPGHSSIAKLPDYESGIWYNPKEVNNIEHPKNFLFTASTYAFIHLTSTADHFHSCKYYTRPAQHLNFGFNNSLQLSQVSPVKKSFFLWASFLTHLVLSILSTSPNDRSLKISKKLLLLWQGKAILPMTVGL